MFKNISSSILIYKCSKSGERITLEPNQTCEFGNDYLIRQKLLSDIGGSVCEKEKADASADLRKHISTLEGQLTKEKNSNDKLKKEIRDFKKEIKELKAEIEKLNAEVNNAGSALEDALEEVLEEEPVTNG